MKKLISITLALFTCIALFSACESKEKTDIPTPSEKSLAGSVSINGSTSMEKVISGLSEAFMSKYQDVVLTYDATGSGAGITSVTEDRADIGATSRNLKEEEKGLDVTVLAIDGIAVIVNKDNPVSDLTIEEIANIAKGEITNWKDVGGNDAPVVFIGREAGSGTRDGFESILKVTDQCRYEQELTSTGAIIAAVEANKNAIGYASLASVGQTVNALKVNGVECNEENILDKSYPIQRNFSIVTKQGKELSDPVKAFIEFALSDEAETIYNKAGVIRAKQ